MDPVKLETAILIKKELDTVTNFRNKLMINSKSISIDNINSQSLLRVWKKAKKAEMENDTHWCCEENISESSECNEQIAYTMEICYNHIIQLLNLEITKLTERLMRL